MEGMPLPWWKNIAIWTVLVAVLLGLAGRLATFGQIPVSVYWDEMAIWNDALSVANTGLDMHARPWYQALYISYGDYKMPGYIWATALVARFISHPLVGVRIPNLFAGVSLIATMPWLAYELVRLGKVVWQKWWWPAASLVAALAPVSLHFSRVGFESFWAMAWLVVGIAALLRGLRAEDGRVKLLLLTVGTLSGVMATYSYFSVRFVWPVVALSLSVLIIPWSSVKRSDRSKYWRAVWSALWPLVASLAVWLVMLLPLLTADFAPQSNTFRLSTPSTLNNPETPHRVNQWRAWTGNSLLTRVVYTTKAEQARQVWTHGWQFLSPDFLFFKGDPYLRHGTGQTGLLWWWMAPFFLIGVAAVFRSSPRVGFFLSLWWAAGVFPAAVPYDVPHTLRSLNAVPVLFLLTAAGGAMTASWIKRQWAMPLWRPLIAVGVMSLSGVVAVTLVQWTAGQAQYAQASAPDWQDGHAQLSLAIQEVRDDYENVVVEAFDNRFYLYYQPWSGLSWSEIQQQPSEGFKRQTLGNVSLESSLDWNELAPGTLVFVRSKEPSPDQYPVRVRVENSNGQEVYRAVEVIENQ